MRYRPLGRSGLQVSEIGLGTMMFGEKTDEATATRIIDRAIDAGVNLIDVADVYAGGQSEQILGRALAGRRHKVLLATKVGRATPLGEGLSRQYIQRAVEASLSRLQTDYIDLYQVHRFDPQTPLEESLEALSSLITQGKVRFIGCSNFAAAQLRAALLVSSRDGFARFQSMQPRYNLVYREIEADLLPLCHQEGIGVLAYSPLAGGILTGKYLSQVPEGSRGWQNPAWQANRLTPEAHRAAERVDALASELGRPSGEVAINWVLANPAVSSALVGPRTLEQWESALAASRWQLSTDEAVRLTQA